LELDSEKESWVKGRIDKEKMHEHMDVRCWETTKQKAEESKNIWDFPLYESDCSEDNDSEDEEAENQQAIEFQEAVDKSNQPGEDGKMFKATSFAKLGGFKKFIKWEEQTLGANKQVYKLKRVFYKELIKE
jgi:hypothetical protein